MTKTPYKVLFSILILVLIVCITLYFIFFNPLGNQENVLLPGQDWTCTTVNGTACTGNVAMISFVGKVDQIYLGSTSWTCTDRNRQTFETLDVSRVTTTNDTFFSISKCMDLNHNPELPATPCMIEFKICILDPHVPAVTLTCKYVKEFPEIGNQDSFSENENSTCGTNATKHIYLMNTGYSITKVEYNNEELYFEKPILNT